MENKETTKEYIIYLLGSEAVCPVCKGMLRFNEVAYFCYDCRRAFDISSYMNFDHSVRVREKIALAKGE